jgi:RNA polymerase sigma-70 factor (ECF subfamily)
MEPSSPSTDKLTNLWSAYGAPIRGYVLSLVRDPAEAEDLTQETFLRAIKKLSTLQDESKLSSWLYRIATNLCHDRFRQLSRRKDSVSLDAPFDDESTSLAQTLPDSDAPSLNLLLEQSEMGACVQRYVEDLPDSYRGVILLHDLEGMTNEEIAEMIGCSTGAVKIRLHRARARLKRALENACAFSTDERGVFVCEPQKDTLVQLSETPSRIDPPDADGDESQT